MMILQQGSGGKYSNVFDDDDIESVMAIEYDTNEIPWMPYYQEGPWSTFADNKRRLTFIILLLSGTSYSKERVAVTVEQEGMCLVIRCRLPDILNENGLATIHSDEPESLRDNDYHTRVRAMSDCQKAQKARVGSNELYAVARINLKFACDHQNFTIRNKADNNGARVLYITVNELEKRKEQNPENEWPELKVAANGEQ
jgi:hypothetical protein